MEYPTLETVQACESRVQICRWYRFLPSASTPLEKEIMDIICQKFKKRGGFIPSISKQIGFSF